MVLQSPLVKTTLAVRDVVSGLKGKALLKYQLTHGITPLPPDPIEQREPGEDRDEIETEVEWM